MKKPKVSIIIPTHNRAEMLKRAIKSVFAQTWEGEFELIIVSDGSKDNTEEIVKLIKDSRIRFIKHEKARGASAARNTGLWEAKGEYIAFLDDDDEWMTNKLEIQMPVIENSGQEIGLVYAWIEYYENDNPQYVKKPKLRGDIFEEMLDRQAITNSSAIVIKRKVLDAVHGFDEELPRGNDGDFIRRISKHYQVDYVPEVLAKVYIGHVDRISRINNKMLSAEIYAYQKRLDVFRDEFCKYPEKKMSILIKIGIDYLLIWKPLRSIAYFIRALRCSCKFTTKISSLVEGGKIGFRRLMI